MVIDDTTSRDTGNRRGKAIALHLLNESEQQTSRIRNAMILLAVVILSTTAAAHAFAAGPMGGLGLSSGFQIAQVGAGFHSPAFNSAPSTPPPVFNMPAPVFNPSEPYTLPQSPETPVSPASPGSVFGNG